MTLPGQKYPDHLVIARGVPLLAPLLVAGAALLGAGDAFARCTRPGDPDCVDRLRTSTGTIDFFATGASFGVNDDTDDRPDRTLDLAEVVVPARRIPARAKLQQAYLYFGGSLFSGDADGIEAPDMDVEIQVPGSSAFVAVRGDQVYRSGAVPGFPEVTLYSVRADITEVMRRAGGEMVGSYRVRGFAADIFNGDSPLCTSSCDRFEHTAANASFSIILIFEEDRLPPRTIVLFDGLQEVLGSTLTLDLAGFTVSQVPSGTLTIYAQEGDCNPGPTAFPCRMGPGSIPGNNEAGLEHIRVIGASPDRSLIVSDGLNPANDVFNRTINTVDPPVTDVPGTDIDTFDITPVLRAGDQRVSVEVTSPLFSRGATGELVGLVYVVVGIDVFAPELRVDSKVEIRTERGEELPEFAPGDPLRVAFNVSNTGNLPATEVRLSTDLPETVTAFCIVRSPEGTTATARLQDGTTLTSGCTRGRGRIDVEGLAVRHGEVNALVLLVETLCPLPEGGALEIAADVGSPREGGAPFQMKSTVPLLPRDRCGPRFLLFGGGGCETTSAPGGPGAGLLLVSMLLVLCIVRARKEAPLQSPALEATPLSRVVGLAGLALAAAIAFGAFGCGDPPGADTPDRSPPTPIGDACPGAEDMVIVPTIRGSPSYCIDRFEASIASGDLGRAVQPATGDGSTTAVAQSLRFARPARGVSWFQARAACANARKRLCSAEEWSRACRGERDLTYPYGDEYQPSTCNGHDAIRGDTVEAGAMIVGITLDDGSVEARGCVSQHGAYDLSGNVWEWNETSFFDGQRRGLAGGSFRANRVGLRCVTEDNHAPPDESNDAFGFRCCRDLAP